jgi:hypothetical protein
MGALAASCGDGLQTPPIAFLTIAFNVAAMVSTG